MKRIFITGGSGFVGRNIIESLQNDYLFYAPTHQELDSCNALSVQDYVKKNKIDTIIHAATAAGENLFESNMRMFHAVQTVAPHVERVIYFGSGAEYEKNRDLVKIKERDFGSHIPDDGYGLSKYLSSLLAREIPNMVTLRLFGVYGPYEDYRKKFISNAIVKHLLHMPLIIKQNVLFDYLYIEDAVSVVKKILDSDMKKGVFNLTPTKSISLIKICDVINAVGDHIAPVSVINPGLNYQYTGDNHRLKRKFPTIRFHPYTKGIEKLYRFYEQHRLQLDEDAITSDAYLQRAAVKQK